MEVSLNYLQSAARTTATYKRRTAVLSEGGEKILRNVVDNVGKDGPKQSEWGALMPKTAIKKNCTDDIIAWTAQNVLFNCIPSDINTCVQTPILFIHSQIIANELVRYKEAGDPTAYFEASKSQWMRKFGLAMLRERMETCGNETVKNISGLRYVAFILNASYHWSLLIYDSVDNDLCHYDSMATGDNSHAHVEVRQRCWRMLLAMGVIPRDCVLTVMSNKSQQRGAWQCGYAVLIFMAHFSRKLRAIMRSKTLAAPTVVRSNELLIRFVHELLAQAMFAKRLQPIKKRLSFLYTDE